LETELNVNVKELKKEIELLGLQVKNLELASSLHKLEKTPITQEATKKFPMDKNPRKTSLESNKKAPLNKMQLENKPDQRIYPKGTSYANNKKPFKAEWDSFSFPKEERSLEMRRVSNYQPSKELQESLRSRGIVIPGLNA